MDLLNLGQIVVAAILGSGLASAGVTIFFQQRFKKQEKREEDEAVVKYLAVRLAFLFEGYALECADKLADHHVADEHAPHAGKFIGEVPEISPLPIEAGHKLLEKGLLNDIFDFPQRCIMANRNAMFWWEVVGDEDCCRNALAQNTVDMGARAIDIGKRLRKTYDLEPRQLSYGEFDMEKFLNEELKKLKAHRERIKKQEKTVE